MDSIKLGKDSNVVRPLFRRWLRVPPVTAADVAEQTPPAKNAVEPMPVDYIGRLRMQHAELMADWDQCSERCRNIEVGLERATHRLERAESRLLLVGEPIPGDTASQLTSLQDSYRNVAIAVRLQEEKLERTEQRIASLQQQCASLVKEMRACSVNSVSALDNQSAGDNVDPDFGHNSFKKAA